MMIRDLVLQDLDKEGLLHRLSQEAKLLVYGVKPALIISQKSKAVWRPIIDQYYPSLNLPHIGQTVYFVDAQTLVDFVNNATKVSSSNSFNGLTQLYLDLKILGQFLGYPEIACQWFEDAYLVGNLEPKKTDKAVIHYHGLQFVCGVGMVDACYDELVRARPVPEEIRTYAYASTFDEKGTRSNRMLEEEFTAN